jgi:hypothetical protein
MPRLTTLNLSNPLGQAFWAMRVIFTIAPILFGLDKFFNFLVDWPRYLAPWIPALAHVSPQVFLYGVGVIEIAAGILVGLWPHLFAYVVVAWLWGIILNLLTIPGYFDVALRDFALSVSALSLARLAQVHHLEKRAEHQGDAIVADPTAASAPAHGTGRPVVLSH